MRNKCTSQGTVSKRHPSDWPRASLKTGTLNLFEVSMSFPKRMVDEVGWGAYSRRRERHRIMREHGAFWEQKTRIEGIRGKEEERRLHW